MFQKVFPIKLVFSVVFRMSLFHNDYMAVLIKLLMLLLLNSSCSGIMDVWLTAKMRPVLILRQLEAFNVILLVTYNFRDVTRWKELLIRIVI